MNTRRPRRKARFAWFTVAATVSLFLALSGIPRADGGHGREEKKAHGEEETPRGGGGMKMKGGHDEAGGHGGGMKMKGGHGGTPAGLTPFQAQGFGLISSLHCNACHYVAKELKHGHGHGGGHGGVAPNLTALGDKFRPDWLYAFLRKPYPIRPWLKIRMPTFRLTEDEAVSLVKHLSTDMRARLRAPVPKLKIAAAERAAYREAGKKLMSEAYFNCWSCHQRGAKKPEGPRENWAPDLLISARRLRPEWIVRWLQDPQKLMPGTKMPAFFEDDESGPEDILGGDETKQIYAIREYILSLGGEAPAGAPLLVRAEEGGKGARRPSAYEVALKRNPDATRPRGFELMNQLNCAGCHDVGGMHEREEAGPPLAHEGSRVRKGWLVRFLKKPYKYRPHGYTAGAASRMPDFRLSDEETEAIVAFLMTRVDPRMHIHAKPQGPSAAAVRRGKRLFAALRCGACHKTKGGAGVRVATAAFAGPNLARASERLQEEHLRLWLAGDVMKSGSKLEMDAHPLVPKLGLSRRQIADLAAFVVSLK